MLPQHPGGRRAPPRKAITGGGAPPREEELQAPADCGVDFLLPLDYEEPPPARVGAVDVDGGGPP
jgi:hypothetical protein